MKNLQEFYNLIQKYLFINKKIINKKIIDDIKKIRYIIEYEKIIILQNKSKHNLFSIDYNAMVQDSMLWQGFGGGGLIHLRGKRFNYQSCGCVIRFKKNNEFSYFYEYYYNSNYNFFYE